MHRPDAELHQPLIDNILHENRDASTPLSKADFLSWVEKRLKIDLSADVPVEDVGKALGVLSNEEQQEVATDKEGNQQNRERTEDATGAEAAARAAAAAEGKEAETG